MVTDLLYRLLWGKKIENQVKKMYYTDKVYLFPFHEGSNENPLFIELAGIEACAPSYLIRRQHSSCSVLGYVARGEGILQDRQSRLFVPTGSVFLWEKHQDQEYWVNPKNPWQILWFNITGELFLSLLSQYHIEQKVYPAVGDKIAALFEDALVPCIGQTHLDSLQQSLNLTVVEIVMELAKLQKNAVPSSKYQEIRKYLDDHAAPPLLREFSLAKMEQTLCISARQINRIFQKEAGITPYEYMIRRKASLASQYLLSTALSVKEISNALGFGDPYYFSNFFKKRYGVSPKQYRQQQKE
jgi:AraC-like DNA-binding protein